MFFEKTRDFTFWGDSQSVADEVALDPVPRNGCELVRQDLHNVE